MKSVIFAMLFSMASIGFSQTHQNGLIIPKNFHNDSFSEYCCVFAPIEGFNLYDAPNGNKIGKVLQKQKANLALTELYVIALANGNTPIYKKFDQGLTEVGYEIFAMSFYKNKDGFVKIFDKKSSYWIKVSEIEEMGYKATNWQDFLIENKDKFLGYYANKPGLNLRSEPLKSAKVLKTLRGDLFEIKLQKEAEGNWNKVKVIKYQEHPCKGNLTNEKNIEYILEGWIKTIDDSGTPNVWYYARGC
ncbi:MAG: hypothetical protein HQ471_04010 [Flavobacteriales bacterium]|nr:hypothetical protein [Flavobacteriales bacterium]